MITYLKRKFKKILLKRTFKEYGFEIKRFQIHELGEIEYAQWSHPFERPKVISTSNINFYKKLSNKGGMIIDIGAHTGDTTVPMSLAVGKEGLVLGLEPNKYVFKILKQNASLNLDKSNIKPLCFAATENDGNFIFNYSDASFCNGGFLSKIQNSKHRHNFTLEVAGMNLQDYLLREHKDDLQKLNLIKIDAEGYDKEIIKTLTVILNDFKPHLMIECYKRLNETERSELFEVVESHDYELYYLEDFEQFESLKKIGKSNMMDHVHFDMLAIHKSKRL
tara:strand:- start:116 stop:949 length:834 start_codon:yes stop_codon:yes gene_type:complete